MTITLQQLTKNWGIPVYETRPRVLSWINDQFVAAGFTLDHFYRGNRGRIAIVYVDGDRQTLLEANFNPPHGHVHPNIAK